MTSGEPKKSRQLVRLDLLEPRAAVTGVRISRLNTGEFNQVRPLFSFVGDQLAEIGGREREHVATQVGKPRLDLGGRRGRRLSLVELVDDFGTEKRTSIHVGEPLATSPPCCTRRGTEQTRHH